MFMHSYSVCQVKDTGWQAGERCRRDKQSLSVEYRPGVTQAKPIVELVCIEMSERCHTVT
jgi:hypothetical protein